MRSSQLQSYLMRGMGYMAALIVVYGVASVEKLRRGYRIVGEAERRC